MCSMRATTSLSAATNRASSSWSNDTPAPVMANVDETRAESSCSTSAMSERSETVLAKPVTASSTCRGSLMPAASSGHRAHSGARAATERKGQQLRWAGPGATSGGSARERKAQLAHEGERDEAAVDRCHEPGGRHEHEAPDELRTRDDRDGDPRRRQREPVGRAPRHRTGDGAGRRQLREVAGERRAFEPAVDELQRLDQLCLDLEDEILRRVTADGEVREPLQPAQLVE